MSFEQLNNWDSNKERSPGTSVIFGASFLSPNPNNIGVDLTFVAQAILRLEQGHPKQEDLIATYSEFLRHYIPWTSESGDKMSSLMMVMLDFYANNPWFTDEWMNETQKLANRELYDILNYLAVWRIVSSGSSTPIRNNVLVTYDNRWSITLLGDDNQLYIIWHYIQPSFSPNRMSDLNLYTAGMNVELLDAMGNTLFTGIIDSDEEFEFTIDTLPGNLQEKSTKFLQSLGGAYSIIVQAKK